MSDAKHYGIVDGIAEHEPGAAEGNLSVSAVLASSVHSPESMIAIGSTAASPIDLAQLVLTAEQAIKLGALIVSAGQEALAANRAVENLRKYGQAAARLCYALAAADSHHVLVNQVVRIGYPRPAQELAERAYEDIERTDGDWRAAWREAGDRLRAGMVSP